MKTAGIIAEYNPFHNGHHYQMETVRHLTGADFVIVAMSGDFLQRGVPAIADKYTPAKSTMPPKIMKMSVITRAAHQSIGQF